MKKNIKSDPLRALNNSWLDQIPDLFRRNSLKYLTVFGILLLVGGGVLFWRYFHRVQAEKLATELYDAEKLSKKEQRELFERINRSRPYSEEGVWSALEEVNLMEVADCAKTLSLLERYKSFTKLSSLRSVLFLKIGSCLESEQKWKQAESLYQEGMEYSDVVWRDWFALRKAIVIGKMGRQDESVSELKKIVQETSFSSFVREEAKIKLIF